MNHLNRYRNELIVAVAVILMLAALAYKSAKINSSVEEGEALIQAASQVQETVFLKEIWGDKALGKKVQSLKTAVPASKVKWEQKGTKVTASYKGLSSQELNGLGKTMLNLGIQIDKLDVRRDNELYEVELVCKW